MKHFNPLSALLLSIPATLLFLDITNSGRAVAQATTPCLPSHTTADLQNFSCAVGAETYGITIHKIAICTSDPLSSSTPDLRSCKILFENSVGKYVDLGTASPTYPNGITLDQLDKSLFIGVYNHIYMQVGTTKNLKAKATVSNGTWYTSTITHPGTEQSKATQNVANYAVYTELGGTFNNGCEQNHDYGGKLVYLSSALQPISISGGTCAGAAYTAMSANATSLLGSPVSITNRTNVIELKIQSTQSSTGLWVDAGPTYVLGSLGFMISLNTSE
jgi:hypothetical protein